MAPAGIPPSTEDLLAVIAAQQAQIAALLARIAELERRLGLNSGNSGKPPSSDGLKKPNRTRSLRERLGNKPGGQKGHPGETLRQSATPDDIVGHYPASCSGCGAALTPAMSRSHAARQVFDLPEPQPLRITEHRAHACTRAACGTRTRAVFPADVNAPVQYGSRIAAFAVYLLHAQFLPEDRLAALMADVQHALCNAHHLRELQALVEIEKEEWSEKMQRLPCGKPCPRARHGGETPDHCSHRTMLPSHSQRRFCVSSGTARARTRRRCQAGASRTPDRPQPADPLGGPEQGYAALPARPQGTVHE